MLLAKTVRVVLAVLMVAGLAACATDADQYYSLQPSASNTDDQARVNQGEFDYVVSVRPVQVPSQLDRSQIVLKGRSGDVSVLNASLWASPLPDELRLAVSSALTQRLGVPDLPLSAVPQGLPVWLVNVDVQRFDSIYNAESVIDITWRLQRKGLNSPTESTSVCRATIARPAGTGLTPLIDAHRESVQVLSDLIAQQISAAQARPDGGVGPPAQVNESGLAFQGCAQGRS
ncbi:MAG: hypothetical protein CML17_05500 [Pusillimonas sp.]|nr:hypothetical protein [Pusillimonas sp.]